MADVFISYKREERAIAELFANAFIAEGYSVFFDASIRSGEPWDKRVERELSIAKAVVVLWSKLSVQSDNVRDEARWAKERGICLPVLIDDCEIPIGMGTLQTRNLQSWTGDRSYFEWRALVDNGVSKISERKPLEQTAASNPRQDGIGAKLKAAGDRLHVQRYPAVALLRALDLEPVLRASRDRYPVSLDTNGPAKGYRYWATYLSSSDQLQFGCQSIKNEPIGAAYANKLKMLGFMSRPNGREWYVLIDPQLHDVAISTAKDAMKKLEAAFREI